MTESFFARRLRWRFVGAWQWPAFAVLTLADGLIIHLLPPTGVDGDLALGLILASFGNLFLIAAVAPWLARRLAARPDPSRVAPPYEVVLSRVSTALLVVGAVGLVAAGLGNRPVVVAETDARETAAALLTREVTRTGDPELQRNLEASETVRLEEGYFRSCVPADDRSRATCWFIDTNADPPAIKRDPTAKSNAELYGRE